MTGRIAFYAPMKPPDHAVPSGDREMARNLMTAIASNETPVDLVSSLRVHDKRGDPGLQAQLQANARCEIDRLLRETDPAATRLWVTYHNYYKAPDLLGPIICRQLGLPYVQIESTRATSRLTGPWAGFAELAEQACDAADLIFYLTDNDLITLDRERPDGQRLVRLRPFLPLDELPEPADCGRPDAPILCVGMMRSGDKLASYRIVADTLARLGHDDWRLDIAGDGPARSEVADMMAPFGSRVRFLGQLDASALQDVYAKAAMFFWPGVNEAFGMVYLEAQAAGLPVVAQDRPGVRDVLADRNQPSPQDGPAALARRIDGLLADPAQRRARGKASQAHVNANHLIAAAAETFRTATAPLIHQGAA